MSQPSEDDDDDDLSAFAAPSQENLNILRMFEPGKSLVVATKKLPGPASAMNNHGRKTKNSDLVQPPPPKRLQTPPRSPHPPTILAFSKEFLHPVAIEEKLTLVEAYPGEKAYTLLGLATTHMRQFLVKIIAGEVMATSGLNLAVFMQPDDQKISFLRDLPDLSTRPGLEYYELVREYLVALVSGVAKEKWVGQYGEVAQQENFRRLFADKVVYRELLLQYHQRLLRDGGMEDEKAVKLEALNFVDPPEFREKRLL
jgi:hypothetical protein